MEQLEQCGTEVKAERNTTKIRSAVFTLNHFTDEEVQNLIEKFEGCEYRFQEEVGTEGTPHLQGYVVFKNPRSFEALKKINKRAHWERTKNIHAARNYCSKEDTATGRFWEDNVPEKVKKPKKTPPRDPLANKNLHPWQAEVLGIINLEPDDRKIYWIVDEKGGAGKTSLCKHICLTHPYEALYVGGKASDMKYAVTEFIQENNLKIALFDFSRTQEDHISYQGIEEIKNGIFFSGKYESGMQIFDNPHVFCFANFEPDYTALSEDRWHVINV